MQGEEKGSEEEAVNTTQNKKAVPLGGTKSSSEEDGLLLSKGSESCFIFRKVANKKKMLVKQVTLTIFGYFHEEISEMLSPHPDKVFP